MFDQKPLSAYTTLISNLSLIIGVLFLGWDWHLLFIIFWVENVVIGFYNIIKMIAVSISEKNYLGVVYVPFFTMHYGIFTAVHGAFVFLIALGAFTNPPVDIQIDYMGVVIGAVIILISHGISLYVNFFMRGEIKNATLQGLMMTPYKRIIILHITIIFGAMISATLSTYIGDVGPAILLIIIKTVVDMKFHKKERVAMRNSKLKN